MGASAITGAHAALKAAVEEQKLTINGTQIAGPPKAGAATQQNALSVAQKADLLAYLATDLQGAMWTTFILTGARRSKVLGLEQDRVQGDTLVRSWQLPGFNALAIQSAWGAFRDSAGGWLCLVRDYGRVVVVNDDRMFAVGSGNTNLRRL